MAKEGKIYQEIRPADWVDAIIVKGIELGASDIHIEPIKDEVVTYFRIDGVLHEADKQPRALLDTIIARLKIMAQLNVAEHRRPLSGHILFSPSGSVEYSGEPRDIRLATFPTILGESAVMRILNRQDLLFEGLSHLGLTQNAVDRLQDVLARPYGMVLVTGPSGSGKTTTLYTILNLLRSRDRSIVTLEDPVELHLEYVRQAQVNPEIGFDFADGLRSILRQDPDVIMIGEIRDDETAGMAIRASMLGRLFFSTMHTNNSVGAIVRFLELEIPRSFLASSVILVIAQRLVRRICSVCSQTTAISERLREEAGISLQDVQRLRAGKGCEACQYVGYKGRSGIFELLFIDKEIQRRIIEGTSSAAIEEYAHAQQGMETLREAAIAKALEGITTLEEAIHTTAF